MNPGVDLNIDNEVWREFKKLCIDDNISASKKVEKFMQEELEKNEKNI